MLKDRAVFPPLAESVSRVRRFVVLRMTIADCPSSSVETAALLVSELATNAIIHACSAFSVVLTHGPDSVTIEVSDSGSGHPALRHPDGHGGRGLHIVDELADEWGIRHELGGTVVFFRLHIEHADLALVPEPGND